jgi:hypothetical protein
MDEQGEFSEDELREQEEGREEPLHPDEIEFYNAYNEHWVHAENRQIMTKYICYLIERATKNQE